MQVQLRTRGGNLVDVVEAPLDKPRILTLGLRMFIKVSDHSYVECDYAEAIPVYPIERSNAA